MAGSKVLSIHAFAPVGASSIDGGPRELLAVSKDVADLGETLAATPAACPAGVTARTAADAPLSVFLCNVLGVCGGSCSPNALLSRAAARQKSLLGQFQLRAASLSGGPSLPSRIFRRV